MYNGLKPGHWPAAALLATLAVAGCSQPRPMSGAATSRLADAALQAGYPQMALNVADNILARDPHNVAALVARGDALAGSGRAEEAATAYRQALAVQPTEPAANLGLGRIVVRSDPNAAERLFRAGLTSRPDNAVLLSNLGVALDLQERHVEAQVAYRHSLAIAPDSAATKTNLGLSLALSGDRAGAQALLAPLAADPSATQVTRDNFAVAQMQAVAPAPAVPRPVAPMAPTPLPAAAVAPPATAPMAAAVVPVAPAPVPVVVAAPAPPAPVAVTEPVAPAVVAIAQPAAPATVAIAQPAAPAVVAIAQPAAPAAEASGVYVQLAAANSQAEAEAAWQRESRRAGQLLARQPPQIAEAMVNGRSFWRLRVPVATSHDGLRLCSALQTKGLHCWTTSTGG
jgi:Flp pilus assembly protein TadD